MRTTLKIDDDVLFAVRERARREGRSSGEILTELARSALNSAADVAATASEPCHGFDPLPHRGAVVSNELIDQLLEEEPT